MKINIDWYTGSIEAIKDNGDVILGDFDIEKTLTSSERITDEKGQYTEEHYESEVLVSLVLCTPNEEELEVSPEDEEEIIETIRSHERL